MCSTPRTQAAYGLYPLAILNWEEKRKNLPSGLCWGFFSCYEIISPKDAGKILIAEVPPPAGREHEEQC
jgi:hypothetical protein